MTSNAADQSHGTTLATCLQTNSGPACCLRQRRWPEQGQFLTLPNRDLGLFTSPYASANSPLNRATE